MDSYGSASDKPAVSGPADGGAGPVAARDIFLCHASEDAAEAGRLVAFLETAGLSCWIAPRDVTPGTLYADSIVRAINGTRVLVLLLSKNSVDSPHVGKEIERASSKRHPIIAIRMDPTPLPPAFEYFLSESHWLEVGSKGIESLAPQVAKAVLELRSGGPLPKSSSEAITPGIPERKGLRAPVLWAMVVVGVVLLAGAIWYGQGVLRSSLGGSSSPGTEKSIAVLPFADMSERHNQEYFADGMAEEILDLLAKIPGLTVIGRTSSFQFKGKSDDLRTIGAQLNVAYVLDGSVRTSGDQVRVTAQLINARTGAHEWSQTYDRHIGDILKLEDAIAAAVVRELQLSVSADHLKPRASLRDREVYDLILRGRHAADRWDREGIEAAIADFQQALDRDPSSADAAGALAITYEAQANYQFAPAAAFASARNAAEAALRIDPTNVDAHSALGFGAIEHDWDWAAAEREFQQVAALASGSADASGGKALLARTRGEWDEALRQIDTALAIDPLDPQSFAILAQIQWSRGHLTEAVAALQRALEIRPSMAEVHFNAGVVLLALGKPDAALIEMQRETTDERRQGGLAMAYHALGRAAESDAALKGMLRDQAIDNAFGIAEVYAFRGQSDDAMRWLERAYDQKDASLYRLKVELAFKSLAADQRFKSFLRKMNLPE